MLEGFFVGVGGKYSRCDNVGAGFSVWEGGGRKRGGNLFEEGERGTGKKRVPRTCEGERCGVSGVQVVHCRREWL